MKFIEEKNDLFNYAGKAWLAHCISADFGMGKGIVVQFNEKFNLKNYMHKNFKKDIWNGKGYCIPVKQFKVFNLITKEKYFHKPTYKTLTQSLVSMRNYALNNGIKTIAMPMIGCGLDGCSYLKVREIILDVFGNTDIKIIVCSNR